MTKQHFLEELTYCLGNMDQTAKNEIISDIGEHFVQAQLAGKTDEEICRDLGDPREIAEQFMSSSYEQDTQSRAGSQSEADYITGSPRHIKPGDLSGIQIHLLSANIVVDKSPDQDLQVFVTKNDEIVSEKSIYIELEGASLMIRQKRTSSLFFPLHWGNITLHLLVPSSFLGDIEGKTGSGNIKCTGVIGLSSLTLSTGSGNIKLIGISVSSPATVSTGSGNINLEDCSGGVKGKTGSGNITASLLRGNAAASTGSGNISIETDEIIHDSVFSTGSGNIGLSLRSLKADMRLSTGSGNINLSIAELNGNIAASSGSGGVKAYFTPGAPAEFILKTPRHAHAKNELPPYQGQPAYTVTLKSSSGNVKVMPI